MNNWQNIFFETYSLLQVFILCQHVRSAEQIIFCRPGLLKQPPRLKKMFLAGLIRCLNPRVVIREVSIEEITEEIWRLNGQAIALVESLTDKIKQSRSFQVIVRLVKDENIIKYFKGRLVRQMPTQLFFLRMAKKFAMQHKNLLVVPNYNEYSHLRSEGDLECSIIPGSLKRLRQVNHIRLLVSNSLSFFMLLLLPPAYCILRLSNGFRSGPRARYKLVMPVIWGFFDSDGKADEIKKDRSDEYFYGKNLRPGEILHTFGYWPIASPRRRRYQRIMKERGYAFADSKKYKLSLGFLKIAFEALVAGISGWRSAFSGDVLEGMLLDSLPKCVYRYLGKKLEIENIDCDVESIRNDYDPAHVISTILMNQEGGKTLGIQHAASPYDCPQLHYIHVDCYVVYGEFYVKLFSPYWDNLRLARIGREKLDSLAWIVNNEVRQAEIRAKETRLYGKLDRIALVLFPGAAEICLERQWNEIYRGLLAIQKIDLNVRIFLRFRDLSRVESSPCLARLAELPRLDSRFVADHDNFSTNELISICDLAIVPQASFALNEAILTEARVFTFEYTGTAELIFSSYDQGLVLNSAEDIIRVFEDLKDGSWQKQDARWNLLRDDLNYYKDGNNSKRLRDTILNVISETQHSNTNTPLKAVGEFCAKQELSS